ncbi:hypothetical protein F2Q69_00050401 [Brassica cretica]|uniref:Uncharacterized protein n=1 Tax=Brassica cretica TaxID=69181 RepID=A0A8S9PRF3_BRACR|nr:hypothetical protein F2Q69_00050401 [Brassica cretica]
MVGPYGRPKVATGRWALVVGPWAWDISLGLGLTCLDVPTGSGSIEVIGNAMRDVMGRPSCPLKLGRLGICRSLPGLNRDKHYSLRIHMGSDRARPVWRVT